MKNKKQFNVILIKHTNVKTCSVERHVPLQYPWRLRPNRTAATDSLCPLPRLNVQEAESEGVDGRTACLALMQGTAVCVL